LKEYFNKFKDKFYVKPFIILIIIVFLVPTVYTFTRFLANIARDYYLESKNFYFNSNRLKKDNPSYQINNWTGVGDFEINISMNSRKNSLLESKYDIAYNISYTCSSGVVCSSNKSSGVIYEASHTDSFAITITPTRAFNDGESVFLNVTATSTVPYVETISGVFQIVVGKRGVSYMIDDEPNRPYMLVSITNAITSYTVKEAFLTYNIGDELDINVYKDLSSTNKAKCVSVEITLTFDPTDIVLDTTSPILKNATIQSINIGGTNYVSEVAFPMDAMSSMEVRFYKIDYTLDYSYPFGGPSIVGFSAN